MPATDADALNAVLEDSFSPAVEPVQEKPKGDKLKNPIPAGSLDFIEWSVEPNGIYRPTCESVKHMPAAAYAARADDRGVFFQKLWIPTDSLIVLDDTASQRVITGIRKFWDSKPRYQQYGMLYKRGIILWGPAGSGKTGTISLLSQELIAMGGLVIFISNPSCAAQGLQRLRKIEPDRPLIAVYEDIDELIKEHNEHSILALLDGEFQIPNVVNIATTNFPERLGARIINRPSRFDERIFVDVPNTMARERYLLHITQHDPLPEHTLIEWIKATDGFTIAHLRELVIAIRCLGQDYDDVLDRLKKMHTPLPALDEFRRRQKQGFGGGPQIG